MHILSENCRDCIYSKKKPERLTAKLILSKIAVFKHNYRTRRALQRLNDDQLVDIGITRQQAEAEYNKPFWQ